VVVFCCVFFFVFYFYFFCFLCVCGGFVCGCFVCCCRFGVRVFHMFVFWLGENRSQMGKETVTSRDYPGFIANRILMPYINEAVFALSEVSTLACGMLHFLSPMTILVLLKWPCWQGVATPEDIDKCMKLGTNVPMGPLTLADFIGLDTCLSIMRVLHHELGDSKYRPAPLLVNYVEAGWLGKKSGRGFYTYGTPKK